MKQSIFLNFFCKAGLRTSPKDLSKIISGDSKPIEIDLNESVFILNVFLFLLNTTYLPLNYYWRTIFRPNPSSSLTKTLVSVAIPDRRMARLSAVLSPEARLAVGPCTS